MPPGLHCERRRLYSELLTLLNFDLNLDMNPAIHSNADPDPASKMMQIRIRNPALKYRFD
jgi:hypothetical protein